MAAICWELNELKEVNYVALEVVVGNVTSVTVGVVHIYDIYGYSHVGCIVHIRTL